MEDRYTSGLVSMADREGERMPGQEPGEEDSDQHHLHDRCIENWWKRA